MLKKTILIPEIHKENYSFGKVVKGLSKVRFKKIDKDVSDALGNICNKKVGMNKEK